MRLEIDSDISPGLITIRFVNSWERPIIFENITENFLIELAEGEENKTHVSAFIIYNKVELLLLPEVVKNLMKRGFTIPLSATEWDRIRLLTYDLSQTTV